MTTSQTPQAGGAGAEAERGERDRYSREPKNLFIFFASYQLKQGKRRITLVP